jgi:hypothetical protein
MKAIDAENMAVEPTTSQTDIIEPSFGNIDGAVIVKFAPVDSESDGEKEVEKEVGGLVGGTAEGGTKFESEGVFEGRLQSPSRKFVDFSHAQRNEASLKVAKKTKKRAQVIIHACIHVHVIIIQVHADLYNNILYLMLRWSQTD